MDPVAVEACLRAAGCSVTPQRLAVARCLHGNLTHPTAGDVLVAVTHDHPEASRATVYNTLALLARLGVVRILDQHGSEVRYDPNLLPHHHAVCPTCGALQDIPDAAVEVRLDGVRMPAAVHFVLPCARCAPRPPAAD